MTRRIPFDPPLSAADIRRNPPALLDDAELAAFGPRGAWQAGTAQLRKAVIGWWVAEADAVAGVLRQARELLDAPAGRGRPWGDPAPLYEAEHRHARALAHWMVGENSPDLWQEASAAQDRALKGARTVSHDALVPAAALCRAMAGMAPPAAPLPPVAGDFAAAILAAVERASDAASLGQAIHAWRDVLLTDQPGLALMTLFALAHERAGQPEGRPETAALPAYVLQNALALPPALARRGWRDRAKAMVGVDGLSIAVFDPLLGRAALTRDKDAGKQPDPPRFASWTRHPDLSLEADWHNSPGSPPRLEIRGPAAGRLAAMVADMAGARLAADPESALAELLTVPPRKAPVSESAARARWEVLCATIARDDALDQMGGRALVRAGLADSDWRVRMAALWAVGHFRLAGVAREAEGAALPESGFRGLSQDDRRILLALRDLAASRSAGLGDIPKKGANAGFAARVAGLIDARPQHAADRAESLIATILRLPRAAPTNIPPAWKIWAA